MKFDLNRHAVNLKGDALKQPKSGAQPLPNGQFNPDDLEPRTIGDLATDALLAQDQKHNATDMIKRYTLAQRIVSCGVDISLSTDDLKLILDAAGTAIKAPLLYGQLAAALEIKD